MDNSYNNPNHYGQTQTHNPPHPDPNANSYDQPPNPGYYQQPQPPSNVYDPYSQPSNPYYQQPYPYPNPYPYPFPLQPKKDGKAVAGMVCSIAALFFTIFFNSPILSLGLGITGLALSVFSRRYTTRETGLYMANAGMICAIIALTASVLRLIIVAITLISIYASY